MSFMYLSVSLLTIAESCRTQKNHLGPSRSRYVKIKPGPFVHVSFTLFNTDEIEALVLFAGYIRSTRLDRTDRDPSDLG